MMTWLCLMELTTPASVAPRPPNVVLIIADDMGYGDLGCHGNPVIRTPSLDQLARQGVEVQRFYVSPVCSPTRASLLTGRYNYRTGVVDTFLGRSMMHANETTLAEMLSAAGYRTGIFGKWHLGDNTPLRPHEQGFHEALVLKGGGLVQPSDFPGTSYFDPPLLRNGQRVPTRGYCSDVHAEEAIRFVETHRQRPFFLYLAFNAPHDPLQVPDADLALYSRVNFDPAVFPKLGQPIAPTHADRIARVYGMVTNLDRNIGRLLQKLDELSLREHTIVIFITDNGPQFARYNVGLRGLKGSTFEGGIRAPCMVHWPAGGLVGGKIIRDLVMAHIDWVPTLLEACGVTPLPRPRFDGVSVLERLRGGTAPKRDRQLFFQWHRGDQPERGRACAVVADRYKLVHPEPARAANEPTAAPWLLFNLADDPFEQHDLAATKPDIVAELKQAYDHWFDDVCQSRGFAPPRIHLGSDAENPVILSRQDWRGDQASWHTDGIGGWEVEVRRSGNYRLHVVWPGGQPWETATIHLGNQSVSWNRAELGAEELRAGNLRRLALPAMALPAGPMRLEVRLSAGKRTWGPRFVEASAGQ